jgi:glycosyltransferase involved in cell wall biosynthesis
MTKPKVGVVVPSGDTVHSRFMICLVSLFQYSESKFDLVIINPRSSLIATGRQMGIDIAVQRGCEYVLFLDSDMVFPYTLLEKLYERNERIVGCTYVKRLLPTEFTHKELDGAAKLGTGLRQASRLPTGALLIDLAVFNGWDRPYFRCCYEDGMERGEDYYFCDTAREAGYPIWLDADLSKLVGHLGIYVHTHNDITD